MASVGRVGGRPLLLALLLAAGARPLAAGPPPDAVSADTLPSDSAAAAADTVPARPDSLRAEREPYFPEAFPVPDTVYSAVVWRCDRSCLLDHSAHNLLDLLESELPGSVPLRGTFFGGPHHLTQGLLGPALTEVRAGELPLPGLSSSQVDLSRVPLAWLSEVQVIRRAGELTIRLVPVRHRTPEAYSRVTAGSGEPNLSLVRGLFTNGIGRHLAVSTGVDLLNTDGPLSGSDRLDFWGMASWTPGDGAGGVELLWRTQNVTRAGLPSDAGDGGPSRFRRRDAYVQARGELASGVRVQLAAGRSEWSERTPDVGGPTRPGGGRAGDRQDGQGPRVEAEGAVLSLQAERAWGFGRASFRTWTGSARPTVAGRLAAGVRPLDGVRVDGSVRAGRWDGFSTRSYGGGIRWSPDLGLGVTVHASASRGTRGVPRPWLGEADSVRFEEYRGGLSASLGPYRLSGLASRQELDRQLAFSSAFDRDLSPAVPEPEILVGQGSLEGPILPLGELLGADVNPLELDLTVRRSQSRGAGRPLFVPRELAQLGVRFRDQFFQEDLGVNLRLASRYRSQMRTVDVGTGRAATVPARTTAEFSIVLRIVAARIWYRSENLGRVLIGNLAGQRLPPRRTSFGIKWEFTN